MSLTAVAIFVLILILANGIFGYVHLFLKQRKIEKGATERGASLSDIDRETIQKYKSQQEKIMKSMVLGTIGMVILLILNLGNG